MDSGAWLGQLKNWWSGLPRGKKSALLVLLLSVVLAAIFAWQSFAQAQYATLFAGLEPRDAAAVVEKLKEMKVPYQLAGEGGTILVPKEKVYEVRLQLAGAGMLPGSGLGFELFDQRKLGMTDFERRLNYQRALQEELRRTIVALDEVEDARVHLVLPEPSVFLQEQLPPSASIALKLKPLASLKPQQVKGIMQLVAGSVEGLKPENIHIIDMHGNVLSEGLAETGELVSSKVQQTQQELRRSFEKDLEQRIQAMLNKIFGPGQAVVMVTADLNFERQEIRRTEYGREGAVRSEQVITETGTGTPGALGPVGDLNREVPGYATIAPAQTNYNKSNITRNYELNQTQTHIITAPGEVRRISTAVVVNGPLDAQREQQIRQIVSASVGYQPARGDQIAVMSMAFDRSYLERVNAEMATAEAERQRREQLRQYITWGIMGLSTLLVLIVFLVFLLRRRRAPVPAAVPVGPLPVEQLVTEPVISEEVRREEVQRKEKQDRAREIVRQRPEEAAQLIKAWLSEE
ncbi:MAG: flagellar M-ring protein FliF [Clostridia bacterium]|nr:flagellar M-ring protein FliF [Clostridia bacterium]